MANDSRNPFNVEKATEIVVSVPIRAGITSTATANEPDSREVFSPKEEEAKLAATFNVIQAAYEAGKPRKVTLRAKVVE
jgi:hypothetical protein